MSQFYSIYNGDYWYDPQTIQGIIFDEDTKTVVVFNSSSEILTELTMCSFGFTTQFTNLELVSSKKNEYHYSYKEIIRSFDTS